MRHLMSSFAKHMQNTIFKMEFVQCWDVAIDNFWSSWYNTTCSAGGVAPRWGIVKSTCSCWCRPSASLITSWWAKKRRNGWKPKKRLPRLSCFDMFWFGFLSVLTILRLAQSTKSHLCIVQICSSRKTSQLMMFCYIESVAADENPSWIIPLVPRGNESPSEFSKGATSSILQPVMETRVPPSYYRRVFFRVFNVSSTQLEKLM